MHSVMFPDQSSDPFDTDRRGSTLALQGYTGGDRAPERPQGVSPPRACLAGAHTPRLTGGKCPRHVQDAVETSGLPAEKGVTQRDGNVFL